MNDWCSGGSGGTYHRGIHSTVGHRGIHSFSSTVQSDPQVLGYSGTNCTDRRGDLTPVLSAFRGVFELSPL